MTHDDRPFTNNEAKMRRIHGQMLAWSDVRDGWWLARLGVGSLDPHDTNPGAVSHDFPIELSEHVRAQLLQSSILPTKLQLGAGKQNTNLAISHNGHTDPHDL